MTRASKEKGSGCAVFLIIFGVGIALLATAIGLLLGFFIADDQSTGATATSLVLAVTLRLNRTTDAGGHTSNPAGDDPAESIGGSPQAVLVS